MRSRSRWRRSLEGLDLLLVEIADRNDGHEIGAVPVLVEAPQLVGIDPGVLQILLGEEAEEHEETPAKMRSYGQRS